MCRAPSAWTINAVLARVPYAGLAMNTLDSSVSVATPTPVSGSSAKGAGSGSFSSASRLGGCAVASTSTNAARALSNLGQGVFSPAFDNP